MKRGRGERVYTSPRNGPSLYAARDFTRSSLHALRNGAYTRFPPPFPPSSPTNFDCVLAASRCVCHIYLFFIDIDCLWEWVGEREREREREGEREREREREREKKKMRGRGCGVERCEVLYRCRTTIKVKRECDTVSDLSCHNMRKACLYESRDVGSIFECI